MSLVTTKRTAEQGTGEQVDISKAAGATSAETFTLQELTGGMPVDLSDVSPEGLPGLESSTDFRGYRLSAELIAGEGQSARDISVEATFTFKGQEAESVETKREMPLADYQELVVRLNGLSGWCDPESYGENHPPVAGLRAYEALFSMAARVEDVGGFLEKSSLGDISYIQCHPQTGNPITWKYEVEALALKDDLVKPGSN